MAKKSSNEELENEQHIDIDESVKRKVEELMSPPAMESKFPLGKELEEQAPTRKSNIPKPGQVIEGEPTTEGEPAEKTLVLDGNSAKTPEEVLKESLTATESEPVEKEAIPADDPQTEKVVDEIVAKEGDDILAA